MGGNWYEKSVPAHLYPAVGDYSAPHLAGFKGPTSKGREVSKEGSTRHYTFPRFFILVTFTFFSVLDVFINKIVKKVSKFINIVA